MPRALLISVRFHDGRYHGQPEWPPSPARLFQALVAGAANGQSLTVDDRAALAWLAQLAPPVIAAPAMRVGRGFTSYVPNNDLDSVGGDPARVGEIRAAKLIKPRLFDARMALLYLWRFDQGEEHAARISKIAELLYQLGRGVDMAWAWAEIIDDAAIDARLAEHGGTLYRPCEGGEGFVLSCPQTGSLESLEDRFEKAGRRFTSGQGGKGQLFSQAPKPRFAAIAYDSPPERALFELREATEKFEFAPWPFAQASKLVEGLRNRAVEALKEALPDKAATVERVLIGRDAKEADKATRVRIIPLPSIGSPHVVRSIRRVLVEVPANCPLAPEIVRGAFSGLLISEQIDPEMGEVVETRLVPTDDAGMLRHYGIGGGPREGRRVWRTVTPAALPERAARRRIDPVKLRGEREAAQRMVKAPFTEAKASGERMHEEDRAVSAVVQALRHAGVRTQALAIRVQREPFEGRGARAEAFADGPRFTKEPLWHAEITFAEPVSGPLVIGDGRYLGLGVMAPVRDAWREAMIFAVPAQDHIALADGPALLHAVRRALMALSRDHRGDVPRLFSGHEENGERAASGRHEHVFLAADDLDADGRIDRIIVAAPWLCDRTLPPEWKMKMRKAFDEVVSRLDTVRAGRLGVIAFGRPTSFADRDPLIGPARVWESRTPYRATRHAGRRKDPAAALVRDVTAECMRRGLPRPEVDILECSTVSDGGGLTALARLRFAVTVHGPVLLGRDSHRGGGLFAVPG